MSIIYNNQVVAGKYKEQIINNADTINAGIIKIATQQEIEQGENNTSAVTPYYLSTKQDKLVAGDGIVIDENLIECTVYPDGQTIIQNDNGTINCVGQLTKAGTIKFDWEGTEAEYTEAMKNGIIQPDWYCYITDDESIVDYADVANQSLNNLRPDGEARFDSKSNIDLDNLSYVGENHFLHPSLDNLDETGTAIIDNKANINLSNLSGSGEKHFLNKTQITNCLLEVPQNIKLELVDNVLTLKAGSKVIVPNGFEADGVTLRFDENVIGSDMTVSTTGGTGAIMVSIQNGSYANSTAIANCISGSDVEPQAYSLVYNTTNNTIIRYSSDPSTGGSISSFPIAICTQGEVHTITSIDQVFNGMGYIGSTIWVDKGVKGLIPNGRNEDGTLKNIEYTTENLVMRTMSSNFNGKFLVQLLHPIDESYANFKIACTGYSSVINNSYDITQNQISYIEDANIIVAGKGSATDYYIYERKCFYVGDLTVSDGKIASFQPKLPVHLVDRNEFEEAIVVTETYSNGASWYRVWSSDSTGKKWCEQGGRTSSSAGSSARTVSLLKTFSNTDYYVSLTSFVGGSSSLQYNNFQCTARTTSNFTAKAGCSETIVLDWYACGYMA